MIFHKSITICIGAITAACFFVSCNSNKTTLQQVFVDRDSIFNVSSKCSNSFKLLIANNTNYTTQFYLTPLNYDFLNDSTILSSLHIDSLSDNEKCMQLWHFVKDWTYHKRPFSDATVDIGRPAAILYTFEHGYCDDRNTALAVLCAKAGVKSRLYNLNGHVVAEMYYHKKWHMYDADKGILYYTPTNEIASVAYLEKHNEIINTKTQELEYYFDRYRNKKTLQAIETMQDNVAVEIDSSLYNAYQNAFALRAKEEIVLTSKKVTSIAEWFWTKLVRRNGPYYTNSGIAYRIIDNTNSVINNGEYIYSSMVSPFAITRLSVASSVTASVYYSTDSLQWFFKGVSNNYGVKFDVDKGDMIPYTFRYYLKIVPNQTNAPFTAKAMEHFVFSDKLTVNNLEKAFRIVKLARIAEALEVKTIRN